MSSFLASLHEILLSVALLTTIFVYLLYPLVLYGLRFFFRSKRKNGNEMSLPKISVIVPTYNEAYVIESKLVSLLNTSYPQSLYEIVVVDSGSSDGTWGIAQRFENDGVILLRQEKRMGKASAINVALKQSKGDIIVVSDANSVFGPDALNKLVRNFSSGIGGVQARICPHNNASLWDRLFHWVHHIHKTLESSVDSVFFASGKLFAFRRELITQIDENAAADDLEMALTVRRGKHKIKYAPEVEVVEKTPATRTETRIQRVRRAFGVLQAMRRNMVFLLNPQYGAYGLIVFPTHFLQMTFQPFFIFYLLIVLTIETIRIAGYVNATGPYFVGVFFGAFLFLLFLSKKFRKICSIGVNFLVTQIHIVLAILDLLRGKSHRIWKKVSSTRDTFR